jgi:hypothetical protein
LGYELFLILFPKIDPYGANRFRAHQPWDAMGQIYSTAAAGLKRSLSLSDTLQDVVSSPMNYRSDLEAATGKPFPSWTEKYGPHAFNGDFSTTAQRWDLDDPMQSIYSGLDAITTRGLPPLPDTFPAEDVVVLYDGYCASTCTIFSEFMRHQAGVDTIAFGGRPSTSEMQAVGGTKGTNNWPWSWILEEISTTFTFATESVRESWRETDIGTFNTFLPFHRTVGEPNVNMRDGLRKGDDSGTPLQFIVEPADCRMFYTPDMTVDITRIWTAAADVKWLGKKRCVAGGFKGVQSSDADGNLQKRATKSKTATVRTMAVSAVAALEASFGIITDFTRATKRTNGLMAP